MYKVFIIIRYKSYLNLFALPLLNPSILKAYTAILVFIGLLHNVKIDYYY